MNAAVQSVRGAPLPVQVIRRVQESPSVFSLTLAFTDAATAAGYRYAPGQFNMLYLYGVGEVPISIVSDPGQEDAVVHTIRAVGRVTHGLARLQVGDQLGLRGPFGRGWPLDAARGRDLLLLTGGLGCAPLVAVINYVMRRRGEFGRLALVQGVKHVDDLIWRERYAQWAQAPQTQVLLAADVAGPGWQGHVGLVTELLAQLRLDLPRALAMVCGPEPMMIHGSRRLLELGMPAASIWLSMERNMQCATGHCGHCQFGPHFICRDGPVFNYTAVADRLGLRGV